LSPALSDIITQLGIVLGAAAVAGVVAAFAPGGRAASPGKSRGRTALLLGAAMVAFAVTFAALAVRKYGVLAAPAVDLGVQHHVFWAGGRGAFLYQTVLFSRPHLNHVALLTQLISPASRIFSGPTFLLVLQAAALASAAMPAFLIARRHTASRYLALAFALSPLLFASTQWVSLYDFHPRTFAPALFLWALWGAEAGRPRVSLLFFFLAILGLEELALYACAAGVFVALGLKQARLGWTVAAAAAFHFLVCTYVVYPQLMDVSDLGSNPILNTFGVATSPLGLVAYAAGHPGEFLARAADPARLAYLLHWVGPWAFLPLAAGWGWLAYLTPATYALFSKVPSHYALGYQYAMPLLPFLAYFAVRAWGWVERRVSSRPAFRRRAVPAATTYLLAVGLASSAAFGPLGARYRPEWFAAPPELEKLPRVARYVSAERSLAATMYLLPHFSERWRVYLLPHKFSYQKYLFPADVLAETTRLEENWLMPAPGSEGQVRATLAGLLRDRRYGCVFADGDFILLRRGATPAIPADKAFEWTFQTIEETRFNDDVGVRVFDDRARNGRTLYCPAAVGPLGALSRAGPAYWPPGVVKVTYALAVEDVTEPFQPAALLAVAERRDDVVVPVAGKSVPASELPADGGYGRVALAFECDGDKRYEFHAYGTGNGDLSLDYIYVEAPTLSLERAFRRVGAVRKKGIRAAEEAEMRRFLAAAPTDFGLR
jgi:uncharacterized membrane protein